MFVKTVTINDFRGLREGKLEGFIRINILVSRDNTEKSTVLEAIYLVATGSDSDVLERTALEYVVKRRAWYGCTSIDSLIYMYRDSCGIALETNISRQSLTCECSILEASLIKVLKARKLEVSALYVIESSVSGVINKRFKHYFDDEDRHHRIVEGSSIRAAKFNTMLLDWYAIERADELEYLYSLMCIYGGTDAKRMVLDYVRESYNAEDMEILRYGDRWVLHVDYRDRSVLAHVMDDVFKLALVYLMLLAVAFNALLLLEEPELHMYLGLLCLVARAIVKSYREEMPSSVVYP